MFDPEECSFHSAGAIGIVPGGAYSRSFGCRARRVLTQSSGQHEEHVT